MPLTSHDASKLSQNVVTDLTSPNVRVQQPDKTISHEAALLFNAAIVARPLMMPEVAEIEVKNHDFRYRWVFTGSGGRMYSQRRAQGFVNATNEDVNVMCPDVNSKDGAITSGDVVMMKIRADLYDGQIKKNMLEAMAKVGQKLQPGELSGKVQSFTPSTDTANKIMDESVKAGRAEETRKVINDLKASHKEL